MDIFTQILSKNYTKLSAIEALEKWRDANPDSLSEMVEKVRKKIEALEPLHLFLAQEMPEEELEKIVAVLRKDYGENFLIEIKIDPDLIGGCTLSYKGVYKDYSIKNKLWKLDM